MQQPSSPELISPGSKSGKPDGLPAENDPGGQRRSTNACRRCKRRKIKCFYRSESNSRKCVACSKSHSDCLFDVPPDGALRSHAYVATLERRIKNMERELRQKGLEVKVNENRDTLNQINDERGDRVFQGRSPNNEIYSPISSREACPRGNLSCGVPIDLATHGKHLQRDIAVLDMIQVQNTCSDISEEFPPLPSDARARELVDTVYFYTQARYCIIDWVQLREWHRNRESIAYATTSDPLDLQIGSFFIWIIYAIGACLVPISESSTEEYFCRARIYIPIVMSAQNMDTVQALLCLVQYSFRAQNDSPLWDLVGIALRLCVKLKYHRRIMHPYNAQSLSAYKMELQKRFFWCAYCFDRLVSMLSKLPFGIRDVDIDAELPVDINDTCIDEEVIRSLQEMQINEETTNRKGITTMTAALHHLRIYRIRSSILTEFAGPNSRVPTSEEVQSALSELDQWRQDAPRKDKSNHFPQQNADRIHTNYLQAVLLLIRPILVDRPTNFDSIGLCVTFAADACESAKLLSLNPLTLPDRITVYHCFYAGITLLQCLAIKPDSLTPRGFHKAISACSSALAVYTRVLPSVAPFLRLFEDVANKVVCDHHHTEFCPNSEVQSLLGRIISSDPSEIPSILQSLSEWGNQESVFAWAAADQTESETTEPIQYESILGGQSLVAPLNMPLDISPLYVSDTEMMDIWTANWLNGISTEFCGGSSIL